MGDLAGQDWQKIEGYDGEKENYKSIKSIKSINISYIVRNDEERMGKRWRVSIQAEWRIERETASVMIGNRLKVTTVKKKVPPAILARRYSGME